MLSLTRFQIIGLHGFLNIDVPIEDNRLILVGENGTGKSTLANFIYFFLTRQWERMHDYEFEQVIAHINGKELTITHSDILEGTEISRSRRFSPRALQHVTRRLQDYYLGESIENILVDHLTSLEAIRAVSKEIEVPFTLMREAVRFLAERKDAGLSNFEEANKQIIDHLDGRVLFLPTYRRIEQDLRSIFPELEDEYSPRSWDRFTERLTRRIETQDTYTELVEFGMEDVKKTINRKMSQIKDEVRNGLNTLIWTYLREVIQGDYKTAELLPQFSHLEEATMRSVFQRIPEQALSQQNQHHLLKMVRTIQESGKIDDRVVAHFLSRLVQHHRRQQENESDVREFVRICNKYLTGKEVVYDDQNFEIFVHHTDQQADVKLKLKDLSSGEKQIVSLFSHIYLSSDEVGYFVIIDEPELSLSVPWQKTFLLDVVKPDRCSGLIAVTHSPFVFENELVQYAQSIEEFVERV